jgi:AraC-like DNA-binding protein
MSFGRSNVGPFVTARPSWAFAAALREQGVAPEPLLERAGLSPESLDNPETRISHGLACELLASALEVSGDPHLGIRAARHAEQLEFDLLEYLSIASPNRLEAVRVYNQYRQLSHDAARQHVIVEGDIAACVYDTDGTLSEPPAFVDYALGWIVTFGRRVSGRQEKIVRVELRHPAPADVRPHEEFFQAPVRFGAPRNAILYDVSECVSPHPHADPRLRAVLERQGKQLLERLPRAVRFQDEVKLVLAAELERGNIGLKHVARRLHASVSTVRQRLQQEGTSYRELLDEQRRELAYRYLSEPRRSVSEVAELLGFSYESALIRAFRRWTGMSPTDYRRRQVR